MRYPQSALVAVLALVSVPAASGQPQAELVLHFVEIGQGDCTLIECPNGGFILVDAGSTAHGDRDAVRQYIRAEVAYRDKLKQIKKGLMHDLLTGRVRVSGAVTGPATEMVKV